MNIGRMIQNAGKRVEMFESSSRGSISRSIDKSKRIGIKSVKLLAAAALIVRNPDKHLEKLAYGDRNEEISPSIEDGQEEHAEIEES